MRITVNREFLWRHLFAVAVLAGMGCWFGYDGYVRYPSLTPAALYADAHNGEEPPTEAAAEKFYRTAIPRQKEFMTICLAAALLIAAHLAMVCRLRFEFDDDGFIWNGKRYAYGDIQSVDRTKWAKKGILRIALKDGRKLTLDAWHHKAVAECEQKMV